MCSSRTQHTSVVPLFHVRGHDSDHDNTATLDDIAVCTQVSFSISCRRNHHSRNTVIARITKGKRNRFVINVHSNIFLARKPIKILLLDSADILSAMIYGNGAHVNVSNVAGPPTLYNAVATNLDTHHLADKSNIPGDLAEGNSEMCQHTPWSHGAPR